MRFSWFLFFILFGACTANQTGRHTPYHSVAEGSDLGTAQEDRGPDSYESVDRVVDLGRYAPLPPPEGAQIIAPLPEEYAPSGGRAPEPGPELVLRDATLPDGTTVQIGVRDGRITHVRSGTSIEAAGLETVSLRGRWVVPAFIDSHVHLAYLPVGEAMADGGVAAVVDFASPMAFLSAAPGPLHVVASGPMVTSVGGYPTRSWGSEGYGIECANTADAISAVERLHGAGARLIKVPMGVGPSLGDETLAAVVRRAHQLEMPVSAHALSEEAARRAASLGVDVLAHTPVEPLTEYTLASWSDRVIVSTLSAFGGSSGAVANLRTLHARGATVLYGTDLGNTRQTGVQRREIELLMEAGLDGRAIIESGTSAPAAYWGVGELGALAPGKEASLMVLAENPYQNPLTLASPVAVLIRGEWRLRPPEL